MRAQVEVKIRKMNVSDIPEVLRIEESSFPAPWSYWLFFQELISPQRYYIIAEKEEKIIGYAGINWVIDEAHITTIAVIKKERRTGIASLLLERLVKRAKELNLKFLTLEVRESNIAAQLLYLKHNFKVEGRRIGYYSSPREDALIMTLYL